jgi:hypothetical protein
MTDKTTTPTPEQEQRAKWDLLLADMERRAEEIRRLPTYEGWKLVAAGLTVGAAVMAAGMVTGAFIVHLLAK